LSWYLLWYLLSWLWSFYFTFKLHPFNLYRGVHSAVRSHS
jgi:hypothetical protein